jgi:hypothetical protein
MQLHAASASKTPDPALAGFGVFVSGNAKGIAAEMRDTACFVCLRRSSRQISAGDHPR